MDIFAHIKSVIGIILGLSIAKLLQGTVKLIQHPGRTKPYWIHLAWALYIFLYHPLRTVLHLASF